MKHSIRVFTNRLACFVLGAMVLAAGAALVHAALFSTVEAASQATITSDKPDYHPGEIVTLTGSGWKPGELVTIVMSVNPLTHNDVTLTAIADASGNLKNSDYVVQQSDLGVTFHVQATGSMGDAAAPFTFTDTIGTPYFDWHVGPPSGNDYSRLQSNCVCIRGQYHNRYYGIF